MTFTSSIGLKLNIRFKNKGSIAVCIYIPFSNLFLCNLRLEYKALILGCRWPRITTCPSFKVFILAYHKSSKYTVPRIWGKDAGRWIQLLASCFYGTKILLASADLSTNMSEKHGIVGFSLPLKNETKNPPQTPGMSASRNNLRWKLLLRKPYHPGLRSKCWALKLHLHWDTLALRVCPSRFFSWQDLKGP